ncbi:hypothetical protein ACRAWF_07745 [Streptomyces sp. L7]
MVATKFERASPPRAGRSAWLKIQQVAQAIRERLGRSAAQQAALAELDESPDDLDRRSVVAAHVRREAESDPEFAARLDALVRDASTDEAARTLIAHASGNAKQINIAGNNAGPITLS